MWTSERRPRMILAPLVFRRIPDAQRRCSTRVLQAASVTPDPIGDVLNVRCGHLTVVVLLKIRPHRPRAELRVLGAELAGEAWRGPRG